MVELIVTDKWEYKVVRYDVSIMKELGEDRWELVQVDDSHMYFKRPLVIEKLYTYKHDGNGYYRKEYIENDSSV